MDDAIGCEASNERRSSDEGRKDEGKDQSNPPEALPSKIGASNEPGERSANDCSRHRDKDGQLNGAPEGSRYLFRDVGKVTAEPNGAPDNEAGGAGKTGTDQQPEQATRGDPT